MQLPYDGDDAYEDRPLMRRNWTKDYFTSALPFQQRGNAPALPVVGTIGADSISTTDVGYVGSATAVIPGNENYVAVDGVTANPGWFLGPTALSNFNAAIDNGLSATTITSTDITSSLSSVDIADLRLAFQLQVWMERNARAGVRYTEF